MTYQLYIELEGTNPLVWRRLLIPGSYNLYRLHLTLQAAFGWENRQLFEFRRPAQRGGIYGIIDPIFPEPGLSDAKRMTTCRAFRGPGSTLSYDYDFGDDWRHQITLERILPEEHEGPRCIEGAGACPPEDVGGLQGYTELLAALNDPNNPYLGEFRDWLDLGPGEDWDPTSFNLHEANQRLALLV